MLSGLVVATLPVVPSVPLRVVLDEGFEHNTATPVVPLPSYTSATGATYTVDAVWLQSAGAPGC